MGKEDLYSRLLVGLIIASAGIMLTLKEHNREEGARSWVLALGYIGTALGTVYAFGLFFGSFMILGDILDQT